MTDPATSGASQQRDRGRASDYEAGRYWSDRGWGAPEAGPSDEFYRGYEEAEAEKAAPSADAPDPAKDVSLMFTRTTPARLTVTGASRPSSPMRVLVHPKECEKPPTPDDQDRIYLWPCPTCGAEWKWLPPRTETYVRYESRRFREERVNYDVTVGGNWWLARYGKDVWAPLDPSGNAPSRESS